MPYYKRLIGAKCYLSPCTGEDAEMWAAWGNDLEVTLPLGDEAYVPTSLDKERQNVAGAMENQDHVFTIVDLATDRPLGRIMLFGIDPVNRSGMLGVFIGEKEFWGKGYGQEAIRLILDHAFNLLNLHSVMLGTFAFNERAIRCYRRVGFKEIGRRRQARIFGDRKCDALLMDILAEEFESPYVKKLLPPED